MKELNKLNRERIRDWFIAKYDWDCYKQAEKEFYIKKYGKPFERLSFWKQIFVSITEDERQWLIKRTKEILEEKWKEKTSLKSSKEKNKRGQ